MVTLAVASVASGAVQPGIPADGAGAPPVGPANYLAIGFCVAGVAILIALWLKNVIRPGSFPRGRLGRDPTGHSPITWLLCACAVYLATVFGGSLVIGLPEKMVGAAGSIKLMAIASTIGYSVAIACGAAMLYFLAPGAPNAGLRFRWKDLLIGAGAFLLMLPVVQLVAAISSAIATLINGSPPDAIAHTILTQMVEKRTDPWIIGLALGAVLGAPIMEEIVFRIFLQSAFLHVFISRWIAIICTGIVFMLVHVNSVPPHALVPIFTLGIAAGIAYERTSRPGVPIVMHALFNLCNVLFVMLVKA